MAYVNLSDKPSPQSEDNPVNYFLKKYAAAQSVKDHWKDKFEAAGPPD